HTGHCVAKQEVAAQSEITGEVHYSLFTTPTCPNCKIAIPMLKDAGLAVDIVDATAQPDSAKKYGVKQAPTLVVTNGTETAKYSGVAEIKKFLDKN
ncbi:MAG: thioredoxin family protein, partial [Clostridiales bacterium]|nr:thioredoxin family protein [Clostridiales bacterium]